MKRQGIERLLPRFAAPSTRVVVTLVLWLLLCASAAGQANDPALETRVKAAFLFKFGSYVEWPAGTFASEATPLTIGVSDADEMATQLRNVVAGHTIDGRPVVIQTIRAGQAPTGVNILFVGKSGANRLAQILAPLRGQSVLVVTEADNALDSGSIINFVLVDGRIRFDVALPRAESSGLKISSRLLAVARRVEAEP